MPEYTANQKTESKKQHPCIVPGITQTEAFREYCENGEFRRALNGGMFRYVQGCFVIDHGKYVKTDGSGGFLLTRYAHTHLNECALQFSTFVEHPDLEHARRSGLAFRIDKSILRERRHYEDDASGSIIDNAEALLKLRDNFDTHYADQLSIAKTFAETAKTLMQHKKWNSVIFKEKTHLDDSMYSRIIKNNERPPSFRTAVAICVGLGVDAMTANKLISLAGYSFSLSKEHQAFSYLFSALHGKSIDECNAFLESVSIAPLGNRERQPASNVAEKKAEYKSGN